MTERLITDSIEQTKTAAEVVSLISSIYNVGDFKLETEPQEPGFTLTIDIFALENNDT